MKLSGYLLLIISVLPFTAKAQMLEKVNIIIDLDSIKLLEQNPFTSRDVIGTFVADTGVVPIPEVFDSIKLNYRGAYTLKGLIDNKSIQRNWKVKVKKTQQYLNRKEWNFNYQNHVRQFMADYLMRKAGVPMSESKFVLLYLNNVLHGLYLRIEDVDNKNYLTDAFGSNKGDAYKATYDSPVDPNNRSWADLSYLGPNDEDYFMHYSKKTNNELLAEFDYSSIRKFTELINFTPDEEFEDSIKKNFAWENFLKYMVVGNFISNWDGYPQRPKNYWLYNNPLDAKWNFIPWDMDATFNTWGGGPSMSINMMGKTCSIFYYMDKYEPYSPGSADEPKERPLTWRMMKIPFFRNYYVNEYKKAMNSYLSKTMINSVLDSISSVVKLNESSSAWNSFQTTVNQTKTFLTAKTTAVTTELNNIYSEINDIQNYGNEVTVFPNPAQHYSSISINIETPTSIKVDLYDITGRFIQNMYINQHISGRQTLPLSTNNINSGNYILKIKVGTSILTKKLTIIKLK